MRAKYWAVIVVLLAAGAGVYLWFAQSRVAQVVYIDPTDVALVALGKKVYDAQCASCHGAQLEGQANWRDRMSNGRLPAPPHDVTGHTWHHPDAVLVDIVKNGLVPGVSAPLGYQSDMPAYGAVLSDADIQASLAYIKSQWPQSARDIQRKLTEQPSR